MFRFSWPTENSNTDNADNADSEQHHPFLNSHTDITTREEAAEAEEQNNNDDMDTAHHATTTMTTITKSNSPYLCPRRYIHLLLCLLVTCLILLVLCGIILGIGMHSNWKSITWNIIHLLKLHNKEELCFAEMNPSPLTITPLTSESDLITTTNHTATTPTPTYAAYIISLNTTRYEFSRRNLERHFPNFFHFHLVSPVPLTDVRMKNWRARTPYAMYMSGMLTYMDLWMELGSGKSTKHLDDNTWFFIFEDDVNVYVPPDAVPNATERLHFNYIPYLSQLLVHPVIRDIDGWFSLGGHWHTWDISSPSLRFKGVKWLSAHRGVGKGFHATAATKWRLRTYFNELMAYVPIHHQFAVDATVESYVQITGKMPYVFGDTLFQREGANTRYDHTGVVFQDRHVRVAGNAPKGNTNNRNNSSSSNSSSSSTGAQSQH